MRFIFGIFVLCLSVSSFAQKQTDTTWNKRSYWVAGGNIAVAATSVVLLNEVWYKKYPKSKFHTFDDSKEWLQMDKLGHSYTTYQLSNLEFALWRWARMPEKKAAFLSAGIAWSYQFSIEIFDAFNAEWGFSWSDLTANTLGAGLFLSQQLGWKEQRFQLKFGYLSSPYARIRPNTLGSNFPERLLKDYNAQSYWLCVAPGTFFKESRFPKWLQIGVGYSSNAKLHGDLNSYTDPVSQKTYFAQREFALSIDIDWSQLPIKKPWLRKLLKPLNSIKIPFPSVFWRGKTCYFGFF